MTDSLIELLIAVVTLNKSSYTTKIYPKVYQWFIINCHDVICGK